jgi:hypothetical protein
MKLSKIIFVLATLISTSVFAAETLAQQKLLISDVDDTVRSVHVQNWQDLATNSLRYANAFGGISNLYNKFKARGNDYGFVTGAPMVTISGISTKDLYDLFFSYSSFNYKFAAFRGSAFQDTLEYKKRALRDIIADLNPTEIILVGDNGERDADAYTAIVGEYPQIKFSTFIHQPYSGDTAHKLFPEQVGFLTPAALAIEFFNRGFIEEEDLKSVLDDVQVQLDDATDVYHVIDSWFDCTDYLAQTGWPMLTRPHNSEIGHLAPTIGTLVAIQCSRNSY